MITPMEIHDYEARLARRLLAWGGASVAVGTVLGLVGHATGNRFLRAFGTQTVGWGAIDAGLAMGGLVRARRLRDAPPVDDVELRREAERLRRLLAVNTALDILYVGGGLAVATGRGRTDLAARGHGLAAVVQGAFLFAFDLRHAARVPRPAGMPGDAGALARPGQGAGAAAAAAAAPDRAGASS